MYILRVGASASVRHARIDDPCRLMLDATGASEFALHDVQTAIRECRDITKRIRNPADGKSGEVLHAFAASLQQRSLELGKQFRSLDVGCKGELPIATVVRFLLLWTVSNIATSVGTVLQAWYKRLCFCGIQTRQLCSWTSFKS